MVADAKLPKFLGGRPFSTFLFLTLGITVWWVLDQRVLPARFGQTLRGTVGSTVTIG